MLLVFLAKKNQVLDNTDFSPLLSGAAVVFVILYINNKKSELGESLSLSLSQVICCHEWHEAVDEDAAPCGLFYAHGDVITFFILSISAFRSGCQSSTWSTHLWAFWPQFAGGCVAWEACTLWPFQYLDCLILSYLCSFRGIWNLLDIYYLPDHIYVRQSGHSGLKNHFLFKFFWFLCRDEVLWDQQRDVVIVFWTCCILAVWG